MKKNWIIGASIGAAIAAVGTIAAAIFKVNNVGGDLNDSEDDRGVSPVENNHQNDDFVVQNVKADAINDGYKPIKY